MALYLGNSEKLKIIVSDSVYNLKLVSKVSSIAGVRLLSSDGYMLKDSTGLYLTVKEEE